MSDYIVKDTELTSVANAIRIKGGTNSQLVFPNGFVSAIGNISGGGGGGESDFSTAEVTVVNNHSRNAEIRVACVESEYSISENYTYVDTNTTATVIAILYKGKASGNVNIDGGVDYNIEGEGDVEIDSSDFYVTGDCTITIQSSTPRY